MASEYHRILPEIRGLVDFSSNDYLGLARSEKLGALYSQAGNEVTHGSTGNSNAAVQTEQWLAERWNAESVLVFPSGYMANLGFLSAVPGRHDTIIYDSYSHACIKDGIRLSLAQSYAFRHNDLAHLEMRLKKANGNIYVVVESIYSMDGDSAPLTELAEVCRHYNAHLVVDEAHATGIAGAMGGGLTEALDVSYFARINTFGKAMGLHGASITGPASLKDHLVNHSRPFIYTTAPPPSLFRQIRMAFEFLDQHPELVKKLKSNIAYFEAQWADRLGNEPPEHSIGSAIKAVVISGAEAVCNAAKRMYENGLDVRPILPPTVPTGTERLRICLHSFNTTEEIDGLITSVANLLKGA